MNNKQSNVVSSLLRYAEIKNPIYINQFLGNYRRTVRNGSIYCYSKTDRKIYLYEATFKTVIYITLIALLGQILKGTFTLYSTVISHKATYHILKNIRSNIAENVIGTHGSND